MGKTRLWLAAFGVALAALVVAANIRAGGAPESRDLPSGYPPAAESAADVTTATDVPGAAVREGIRDDVPYEEVVWPWEDDPVWLDRRATALRRLLGRQSRLTENDRLRALSGPVGLFRTLTDSQLREVLPLFPEMRSLWLHVDDLSDAGLESTRALPYLENLVIRGSKDAEGDRPEISAKGMEALSHHQRLHQLGLMHLRIDDEGFAQLGVLQSTQTLIIHGTDLTPRCFQTIARWPAIRHVGVSYHKWNRPIDEATHRAIASLDGRLSILALGGERLSLEGNLTIHPSLLRAVGEIRSLTQLNLGDIDHLSPDDLEPVRNLDNLTHFGAVEPYSGEVRNRFLELEREALRPGRQRALDDRQPAGEEP